MKRAKLKILPFGTFAGQAITSIPVNDLYAITRTEEYEKLKEVDKQYIRQRILMDEHLDGRRYVW